MKMVIEVDEACMTVLGMVDWLTDQSGVHLTREEKDRLIKALKRSQDYAAWHLRTTGDGPGTGVRSMRAVVMSVIEKMAEGIPDVPEQSEVKQ